MRVDRRRTVSHLHAGATAAVMCLSSMCCASSSPAAAWIVGGVPTSVLQQRARLQQHPMTKNPTRRFTTRVAATSEATQSSTAIPTATTGDRRASSTAIVGGGPTGLAVALMLARRGYRDITVLERLREPPPPASEEWGNPERSYNLGIGARGQTSLAKIGAADRVLSWCADAVGRKDWNPQTPEGAERLFSERKYTTKVIARDRLASCLLEEVREKHADVVTVRFGVECTDVKWLEPSGGTGGTLSLKYNSNAKSDPNPDVKSDTESGAKSEATSDALSDVKLNTKSGSKSDKESDKEAGAKSAVELTAELVVGADGVRSAVRDDLEGDRELTRALSGGEVRVKKFKKKNEFAYKVVAFKLDEGWRNDFNYSHRTKDDITLEALPTKEGLQVGVLLFRPDDQRILGLKNAADARKLFEELFPQFANMITDEAYERLALQEVSRLPSFSYTGPLLHLGRSAVLLGDAIKSVKPYFGLGVNTAFEDCIQLDSCLEETGDDLSQALPLFSRRRAPEAKDLVELSRGFDRTGVRGFFGFILPLILDSICHGAAPRVFAPNTIAILQRDGMTFRQIRLRKALDRVMQACLAGAAAAAVLVAAKAAFGAVLVPLAAAFLKR